MFSAFVVLFTIFSALGIGILCAWAVLSALLIAFRRSRQIAEPKAVAVAIQAQANSA